MRKTDSLVSTKTKLPGSLRYSAVVLAVMLICLFASLSCAQLASAQDVGVSVDVGMEMSIQFDDALSGYDFSLGTNTKNKSTRSLVVTSNNPTGFKLLASGTNGTTTLSSSTASTVFSSIASSSTLSGFSGSTWGYSIGSDYTSDNLTFSPIPTSDTQIDVSTTSTKTYPVTIGVSTGYAEAASYAGSMTFTAVAEVTSQAYTLVYNDNYPGGSGSFIIESQSSTAASYTFTITSRVPTRSGYTFLGWNTSASGSAAQYVAGNTITLQSSTNPQQVLYAVWQANAQPVPSSDDNGGSSNAPLTSASPNNTSSSSEPNAQSGQQAPLGVKESTDSYEDITSGGSYVPAIVSLSVAVVATAGLIFVIVGKRDKDDEEEDEEGISE